MVVKINIVCSDPGEVPAEIGGCIINLETLLDVYRKEVTCKPEELDREVAATERQLRNIVKMHKWELWN